MSFLACCCTGAASTRTLPLYVNAQATGCWRYDRPVLDVNPRLVSYSNCAHLAVLRGHPGRQAATESLILQTSAGWRVRKLVTAAAERTWPYCVDAQAGRLPRLLAMSQTCAGWAVLDVNVKPVSYTTCAHLAILLGGWLGSAGCCCQTWVHTASVCTLLYCVQAGWAVLDVNVKDTIQHLCAPCHTAWMPKQADCFRSLATP